MSLHDRWQSNVHGLHVCVDPSLCIVIETTNDPDTATRITVTDVEALVTALRSAQTMVRIYEEHDGAAPPQAFTAPPSEPLWDHEPKPWEPIGDPHEGSRG